MKPKKLTKSVQIYLNVNIIPTLLRHIYLEVFLSKFFFKCSVRCPIWRNVCKYIPKSL